MKKLVYLLSSTFIACVTLVSIPFATAQELIPKEVQGFELVIENSESGILMKGNSGTAWVELGFSLRSGRVPVVDSFGVTQVKGDQFREDVSNANFSFKITRKNNQINLTSFHGTHWTDLSFTLPKDEKLVINQFGVQPLEEVF